MNSVKMIGMPYDEHSSYRRGAAGAPPLIRQALFCPSSNLWTEMGLDLGAPGALIDAGDVTLPDGIESINRIELAMAAQLSDNSPVIALGGDHAVTYPLVKAVVQHYPELSILHIDAHPDIYDEYDGDRWSHACPFARIMEEGLAKRLVQVGVRTMNAHCRQQAERFGAQVIEMHHFKEDWQPEFNTPVYLSFDMDGLDPAFAPGVSHREPGGLNLRQVIRIIQNLNVPLVAADIVEYNPLMDVDQMTGMVCAKIFKEIAARMILNG